MRLKILVASIVMILFLISCDSRKEMRNQFGDSKINILSDKCGNEYLTEHHIGETYTIKPLKEIKPCQN